MGAFDTMPTPQPEPQQDMMRFLQAVFGNKPSEEHIFIWLLRDEEKLSASFRSLAEIEAYVAPRREKYNIYYGVSTANFALANSSVRYKKSEVTGMYAMWADIDYDGGVNDPRVHKKGNLPPTYDDALEVVYGVSGMPPSLVIHSGHGLQALWLLNEPLLTQTKAERDSVNDITIGWHAVMQNVAARIAEAHGSKVWSVDATHDPARVMRLPGTLNLKQPENPIPSTLDECHEERRYSIEDVMRVISQNQTRSTLHTVANVIDADVVIGEFKISAKPQLPEKWAELVRKNPRAERVLYHKEAVNEADDSLSNVDASLATYACLERWSNQEIVDLISYHRWWFYQQNPEQLTAEAQKKMLRADYYERTLKSARILTKERVDEMNAIDTLFGPERVASEPLKAAQRREVISLTEEAEQAPEVKVETSPKVVKTESKPATSAKIGIAVPDWMLGGDEDFESDGTETLIQQPEEATVDYATPQDPQALRSEALKMLTQHVFGESEHILITNVSRMVAATPIFRIEIKLDDEVVNVNLGSVKSILNPVAFAETVSGHTKMIPKDYKRDTWKKIAQNMLMWTEDLDIGDEATETGLVSQWLRNYLNNSGLTDLDNMDGERAERDLSNNANPIIRDGNIYVFSGHFSKWLQSHEMERLNHSTLGNYLRTYGCVVTSLKVMVDDRRTSISAWRIPLELASPFIEWHRKTR